MVQKPQTPEEKAAADTEKDKAAQEEKVEEGALGQRAARCYCCCRPLFHSL